MDKNNGFIKQFFLVFILWFIPVSGVFCYVFFVEYNKTLNELKVKETINVFLGQRAVKDLLLERISDLFVITELLKLHTEDELAVDESIHMTDELIAFLEIKGVYDQIRLLDLLGNEFIRVDLKDGVSYVSPTQQLQNKSKRYYFEKAVILSEGDIFISPLDLNVEHGEIEQPLKPMIRLSTPLYNQKGEKKGILLLNYLAQNLLDKLSLSTSQIQTVTLLNSDGYWLMHQDNQKVWGFMYDNEERFQKSHPTIWPEIIQKDMGQIEAEDGIFTFESIYPLAKAKHFHQLTKLVTAEEERPDTAYAWKIVSFLSKAKLQSVQQDIVVNFIYVALPLLTALVLISWRLAHYRLKHMQAEHALKLSYQQLEQKVEERTKELQHEVEIRKTAEQRMRYMATYDVLTRMPNRTLINDRIVTVMAMNRCHQTSSALLFIDLDGFKQVNDLHGHEVGDELLKQVSQRMSHTIRASDTVGRYGGDEFVMLLHEVNSINDAVLIAKEIIQVIAEDFLLENVVVNIGCSIGIAIYKGEKITANNLINKADGAMYEVKKMGKNTYKVAV